MSAMVSVIVPTYNREYCVARAIDSALGQTHPSVEVIVVDDGSTDDTRARIAERYAADSRVRYLYQPNRGVSAARNTGIAHARGEYIALLDSDDIWFPWKLEVQVACLARESIGMVWSDMEAIDPAGHVISQAYLREMYTAYRWWTEDQLFTRSIRLDRIAPQHAVLVGEAKLFVGDIYSQMIMGSLVHTSTVVLTRERARSVGGFDESLMHSGEDYDFHLRTCRQGDVGFIPLPTIKYQRGLADRLTRPTLGIHIAANFLTTVQNALARDEDRIRLPRWMIEHVLAEAHAWVAEQALTWEDRPRACRHFARSLRHRPWQPRTLGLMVTASLPRGAGNQIRRAAARVKRAVGRPGRSRAVARLPG